MVWRVSTLRIKMLSNDKSSEEFNKLNKYRPFADIQPRESIWKPFDPLLIVY